MFLTPHPGASLLGPEHRARGANPSMASGRRSGSRTASHRLGPGIGWCGRRGRAFELLNEDVPQIHTVTIDAEGPFGPIPTMVYELNLADLRETDNDPAGSLHLVRKAIQDVAKVPKDRKQWSPQITDELGVS